MRGHLLGIEQRRIVYSELTGFPEVKLNSAMTLFNGLAYQSICYTSIEFFICLRVSFILMPMIEAGELVTRGTLREQNERPIK
jgi:hypothetical protein